MFTLGFIVGGVYGIFCVYIGERLASKNELNEPLLTRLKQRSTWID